MPPPPSTTHDASPPLPPLLPPLQPTRTTAAITASAVAASLLPPTSHLPGPPSVAARNPPSPSPAHPPPPPPSTDAPAPRRFLHVLTAAEGMSGWLVGLQEAMTLAHTLGRVFVLPCVRGGMVVPCSPGKVIAVPGDAEEAASLPSQQRSAVGGAGADEDVLALPAFREDCHAGAALPAADGAAYPLHAYLSRGAIAGMAAVAGGAAVIDYDEWVAERVVPLGGGTRGVGNKSGGSSRARRRLRAREGSSETSSGGQASTTSLDKHASTAGTPLLTRRPDGLIDMPSPLFWAGVPQYCPRSTPGAPPSKSIVGPFLFASQNCSLIEGRGARYTGGLVAADHPMFRPGGERADDPDLFFCTWMRSNGDDARVGAFPAFNPLHYAPARRWLTGVTASNSASGGGSSGGGGGHGGDAGSYAVMQWRSETVPVSLFPSCAAGMLERTAALSTAMTATHFGSSSSPASPAGTSGIPIIIVSDLPLPPTTELNSSSPYTPCRLSGNYDGSQYGRSGALGALLALPHVHTYGAAARASAAIIPGARGRTMDAGVLAIRDIIIAEGAAVWATCLSRFSPVPLSQRCRECAWISEFAWRIGQARRAAGRPTIKDLWGGVGGSGRGGNLTALLVEAVAAAAVAGGTARGA